MGEKASGRWGLPYPSETGEVKVGNVDFEELVAKLDEIIEPSGTLHFTAATTLPPQYLNCEGQEVSRTTYKALFEAIGTAYGAGNGTTTFNVPDYRGRTVVGAGTGSGLTAKARGAKAGEETHVITAAELAAHAHSVNPVGGSCGVSGGLGGGISGEAPNHLHGSGLAGGYNGQYLYWSAAFDTHNYLASGSTPARLGDAIVGTAASGGWSDKTGACDRGLGFGGSCFVSGSLFGGITVNSHNTNSAGSNTAHNNMQPYSVCNVWIKT